MPEEISPLSDSARRVRPATDVTRQANAAFAEKLPFSDPTDFENALRGFIASLEPLTIAHSRGGATAYDLSAMGFLDSDAPDTVNPSLWRQAQLNALHHGLFEVMPGIWQVRSFDIANMTLIRGDTGWIIIDPLTATEVSRAALDLTNRYLGARPVSGIIITHSHVDHYAGILGVVDADDVRSGKVPLIAPAGFVQEALSENILAGNVMGRRATYMYGNLLSPSAQGFVSTGLGAALALGGTSFLVPNDLIRETGEVRRLDGVEIEFQMTPGTEEPA